MGFNATYVDHENNRDDRESLVSSIAFRLCSTAVVGICFLLPVALDVDGHTSSSSPIPARSSAIGIPQSVPASPAAPAPQSKETTQEKLDQRPLGRCQDV